MDFIKYPVPVLDKSGFGKYIARTMYLLETSTEDKPNKIKIAFTGQSITDPNNTWPVELTEWLRGKYPSADIVCRNFAIGGFSTQCLYKRMPNDMGSFYPDLIICYDLGDHFLYDRMIKWVRENTDAEIMIQTEHCVKSYYRRHYTQELEWSDIMSYRHLPEIAGRYAAQLCDIRTPWKEYIDYIVADGLESDILLSDGTHLNEYGQKFMFELMKQFFVYRKESAGEVKKYLENMYIPVKRKDWQGNKLSLGFTGNRVEIIGDVKDKISVKIDGKKPSEITEAYIRTSENTGISSVLGIINYKKPPPEQIFTITIKSFTDEKNFSYTVEGSATGFEGMSDEYGVLDGEYLYMTHESFIFHSYNGKPEPGSQYTFEAMLNGTDNYDGGSQYEYHKEKRELFDRNMLISGISVGEHILELEAGSEVPDIQAVKIYNPDDFSDFTKSQTNTCPYVS